MEVVMSLRRRICFVVVVLALTSVAAADTRMTKVIHTGSQQVLGNLVPEREETVVVWVGESRMRVDRGETSIIVRADQGRIVLLDHSARTSAARDLPLDPASLRPADTVATMPGPQVRVVVTPAQETRVITGWKVRRYDLLVNSADVQQRHILWVTTDLELDLEAYRDLNQELMKLIPNWARVSDELRGIEGFPVRVEGMMRFGTVEVDTSEELVAIADEEAPEGLYDPPSDYRSLPLEAKALLGHVVHRF
jgi:hypothetical protein